MTERIGAERFYPTVWAAVKACARGRRLMAEAQRRGARWAPRRCSLAAPSGRYWTYQDRARARHHAPPRGGRGARARRSVPRPGTNATTPQRDASFIDTPTEHQLDRDQIAPGHPKELGDERTPVERLDAAMRRRDDEDLALDRIDRLPSATRGDIKLPSTRGSADANDPAPQSVDELRTDLAQLDALADQVRASREARAEAQSIVDEASARITELERRPRGILRRGTSDPARLAFERERLKAAEHQIVETAERERELAGSLSARGTPQLQHEPPPKGAAAIETDLAILRQRGRHGALEASIEPYLTVALGPLPEQPRARRTWEQAAHRLQAYRFEHGITDPHSALGPAPTGTSVRARWQRAQRDVNRAQRALGQTVAGLDHQL